MRQLSEDQPVTRGELNKLVEELAAQLLAIHLVLQKLCKLSDQELDGLAARSRAAIDQVAADLNHRGP